MTSVASSSSTYLQSLVDYVQDVKPFHTKMSVAGAISETYIFSDTITVNLTDQHVVRTYLGADLLPAEFSSAGVRLRQTNSWWRDLISDGVRSVWPIPLISNPKFASLSREERFERGVDDVSIIPGMPTGVFNPRRWDGPGITEVRLNGDQLQDSTGYYLSHGIFSFDVLPSQQWRRHDLEGVPETLPAFGGTDGTLKYENVVHEGGSLTNISGLAYEEFKVVCTSSAPEAILEVFGGPGFAESLGTVEFGEFFEAFISPTPGYQEVFFVGAISESTLTGLSNDSTVYTVTITVNGTPQGLSIQGQNIQTFGDLVAQLSLELGSDVVVELVSIGVNTAIKLTTALSGETFSVTISDDNLFSEISSYLETSDPISGTIGILRIQFLFTFAPDEVSETAEVGDEWIITPTNKIVVHPNAPEETWSLIKTNPGVFILDGEPEFIPAVARDPDDKPGISVYTRSLEFTDHSSGNLTWTLTFGGDGTYSLDVNLPGYPKTIQLVDGCSYKDDNIAFTVIPTVTGWNDGDQFVWTTKEQHSHYKVYGSVSGWQNDATVGQWYFNGFIGFKIPQLEYYVTGLSDSTHFEELRPVSVMAEPSVYTITFTTDTQAKVHNNLYGYGENLVAGEEYTDDYVSFKLADEFTAGDIVRIYLVPPVSTAYTQELFPLYYGNGAVLIPQAQVGDSIIINKTFTDRIRFKLVGADDEFPELGSEDDWVPMFFRYSDVLENNEPTSTAEYSDLGMYMEAFSAATGEKIFHVLSPRFLKSNRASNSTLVFDSDFFETYMPLNREYSIVVIPDITYGQKIRVKISEALKVYSIVKLFFAEGPLSGYWLWTKVYAPEGGTPYSPPPTSGPSENPDGWQFVVPEPGDPVYENPFVLSISDAPIDTYETAAYLFFGEGPNTGFWTWTKIEIDGDGIPYSPPPTEGPNVNPDGWVFVSDPQKIYQGFIPFTSISFVEGGALPINGYDMWGYDTLPYGFGSVITLGLPKSVDILPSLPSDDYPENALIYLTSDGKIYKSLSNSWEVVEPFEDGLVPISIPSLITGYIWNEDDSSWEYTGDSSDWALPKYSTLPIPGPGEGSDLPALIKEQASENTAASSITEGLTILLTAKNEGDSPQNIDTGAYFLTVVYDFNLANVEENGVGPAGINMRGLTIAPFGYDSNGAPVSGAFTEGSQITVKMLNANLKNYPNSDAPSDCYLAPESDLTSVIGPIPIVAKQIVQPNEPTPYEDEPQINDFWLDTDDEKLYRWNGSAWVEEPSYSWQSSAPVGPNVDDLWVDDDDNKLYRWDGANWNLVPTGSYSEIDTGTTVTDNNSFDIDVDEDASGLQGPFRIWIV